MADSGTETSLLGGLGHDVIAEAIERHGLDDRAAFETLRIAARSENETVLAVAEAVTAGRQLG